MKATLVYMKNGVAYTYPKHRLKRWFLKRVANIRPCGYILSGTGFRYDGVIVKASLRVPKPSSPIVTLDQFNSAIDRYEKMLVNEHERFYGEGLDRVVFTK